MAAPPPSALERLEAQLRGAAATDTADDAGSDATRPDAVDADGAPPVAAEGRAADAPESRGAVPGYLGIVADDRRLVPMGVVVSAVVPRGPAALAGVAMGDLIVSIDRRAITSLVDLAAALEQSSAGSTVTLQLVRDARLRDVPVVLARRPVPSPPPADEPDPHRPEAAHPPAADEAEASAAPQPMAWLGVQTIPVTTDMRRTLGLPTTRGALVIDVAPNSPAQRGGVPIHALIIGVERLPVAHPDDVARAIAAARPGQPIELAYYVGLRLTRRTFILAQYPPDADDAHPPVEERDAAAAEPDTPAAEGTGRAPEGDAAAPLSATREAPSVPSAAPGALAPRAASGASVPGAAPREAEGGDSAVLLERIGQLERQLEALQAKLERLERLLDRLLPENAADE